LDLILDGRSVMCRGKAPVYSKKKDREEYRRDTLQQKLTEGNATDFAFNQMTYLQSYLCKLYRNDYK